MYGYIYKTTNIVNNKIYVGKKTKSEFDPSYKGSGKLLKLAFEKYGWENFKVEFLCPCFSLKELNAEERFLISYFNARDPKVGYNRAEGGDGGDTRNWLTDEEIELWKRHISEGITGENNPFYGKHHDLQAKARISEAMTSNWNDPDYQAHMHEVRLGNQNASDLIWGYKSGVNRRIHPSLVAEFQLKGWKLGCSPESTEKKRQASLGRKNNLDKVRIHKGDQGRMVDKSALQKYLSSGWELGMSPTSVFKRKGQKAPPDRRYNLICRCCGRQFLGTSSRSKLCHNCKEVHN